jgi:Uma2 family endonuclease
MVTTQRTCEQIALDEPDRQWELYRGVLREKPAMSFGHNSAQRNLARSLFLQTDPSEFVVSINASRVRHPEETYYLPDLAVIPVDLTKGFREQRIALEVYSQPMALDVEIWSPSTGDYDIDEKIPDYKMRGDPVIWRLHPFDRTLTIWRRQNDGTYDEQTITTGIVSVESLPSVTIDLDAIFAD